MMLILLKVASTQFTPQAEWAVPYLYDAVYLYMVLASKMIADGLDHTNGTLMFQKSYEYSIQFAGKNVTHLGNQFEQSPKSVLLVVIRVKKFSPHDKSLQA
jgi:hypothetical protein